jgi:transcriptional regulator with XRE-family HTH domain
MASKPFNVLRVNTVEESNALRAAIARVLTNIQHDHGMTLLEIADAIDVSLGTISNAANKKTDLSPAYRQRLEKVFGPEIMNPVAALSGGQIIALASNATADILPLVSRVGLHIAEARSPDSDGGVVETHRERLQNLPYLRNLYRDLGALIASTEELAA